MILVRLECRNCCRPMLDKTPPSSCKSLTSVLCRSCSIGIESAAKLIIAMCFLISPHVWYTKFWPDGRTHESLHGMDSLALHRMLHQEPCTGLLVSIYWRTFIHFGMCFCGLHRICHPFCSKSNFKRCHSNCFQHQVPCWVHTLLLTLQIWAGASICSHSRELEGHLGPEMEWDL